MISIGTQHGNSYCHFADILNSAERKVIPAHGKALVDTQISIAVPAGTYGRVAPRSGLGRFIPCFYCS